MAGAYSGPHERRLLHDLMDQYNKVTNNTNFIVNMNDTYLIFVIFFTQAKFFENKVYTEIYTVNCQFTQ